MNFRDMSHGTCPRGQAQRPGGFAVGGVPAALDGAGGGDEVLTPGRPPGAAPDHGEDAGAAAGGFVVVPAGLVVAPGAAAGGVVSGVGVVALLSTGTSERPGAAGRVDAAFSALAASAACAAFASAACFAAAARCFFSARSSARFDSHTGFGLSGMRPPNSEK